MYFCPTATRAGYKTLLLLLCFVVWLIKTKLKIILEVFYCSLLKQMLVKLLEKIFKKRVGQLPQASQRCLWELGRKGTGYKGGPTPTSISEMLVGAG